MGHRLELYLGRRQKHTDWQLEDGVLGHAHCREAYSSGWAGDQCGLPPSTTDREELERNKLDHMANVARLKNFIPTFVDPKLQEEAEARNREAHKAYHANIRANLAKEGRPFAFEHKMGKLPP